MRWEFIYNDEPTILFKDLKSHGEVSGNSKRVRYCGRLATMDVALYARHPDFEPPSHGDTALAIGLSGDASKTQQTKREMLMLH